MTDSKLFGHRATYCDSIELDTITEILKSRNPTRHTRFYVAFKLLEQCSGDCRNKVNARNSMMNKILMTQAQPKTPAPNGLFGLGWGGL